MNTETVTLSPRFQIVIPKRIREALGLEPGQTIQAFQFNGRIELIPVPARGEMRGFVEGIDTRLDRENDRL